PSPSSACPFCVNRYVSSTYAADEGVPGMRNSAPGISPAKIAMAEHATIAPTAAVGSMKNVSGTSMAVAMVAVRPGIAPTKRPNMEAAITANNTFQVATRFNAWIKTSMARYSYQGSRGIIPIGSDTRSIVLKMKSQANAAITDNIEAFIAGTFRIRNIVKVIILAVTMKPRWPAK